MKRILAAFFIAMILNGNCLAAINGTLSWNDNSNNEDGFRIERKIGAGAYVVIFTTASNVTSYVDGNLSAGTTYCYRLQAFNAIGNAAYSGEACATTPTTPQPAGNVTLIISVVP